MLLGPAPPSRPGPPILHRAGPALLALGGITSLRYLLAPLAIVGVAFNLADDLPGGLVERAERRRERPAPHRPARHRGARGRARSVLRPRVGAAGSLLVDWNFTLTDDGERLTASRGLLTRRVVTIDRERIRGADVHDTPLRRLLRLVSVTAVVAGLRGRTGGTTLAPVLRAGRHASAAPRRRPCRARPGAPLSQHPRAARRRRLQRAVALPVLASSSRRRSACPGPSPEPSSLVVLAVVLALDRYRQLGHRFDGRRLVLRGGSLRRRWSELDPAGVVAFELRSSPGQRRAGLCTLVVHLGQGAGSRRALDVGEEQAADLLAGLHPRLLEPLLKTTE